MAKRSKSSEPKEPDGKEAASPARFDRKTWERLKLVGLPIFASEKRWLVLGLLAILLLLSFVVNGVLAWASYYNRDLMTALSLRDGAEFSRQLYFYIGALLIAIPLAVFYTYTEQRLALLWRRWLSLSIIEKYLSDRAFYRLTWSRVIDNPDQRIEEDIRSFCAQSLTFLLIMLNSLIQLCLYASVLWLISPLLMGAAVICAACGSVFTYFLGRPLIRLNFEQLRKEADYRYKLINLRDHAESIAFYRGEAKERTRVRQRLKIALDNLLQIIKWSRNLQFFTTGYNYSIMIIPTVLVAPLYLKGEIEFGVVTQAALVFSYVVNALSIVIAHFNNLSAYAAVVTRLGSFLESIEKARSKQANGSEIINLKPGSEVAFEGVTIFTPERDRALVRELNFQLKGRSLLITGPSGSGKSSVLRVVAGLWQSGRGIVTAPEAAQSLFLPQRPYMVLGSLRDQLLYASSRRGLLDKDLKQALLSAGLEDLLTRVNQLDEVLDWSNLLSSGEQQQLAFARLLIEKPRFAFLDEATTAMDPKSETKMYEAVASICHSYVSVGYRGSLARFHHLVLELKGDGNWRLEAVENA